MKFRGKMAEYHCIRKFYAIISSIAKIAKTCVMRLTVGRVLRDKIVTEFFITY